MKIMCKGDLSIGNACGTCSKCLKYLSDVNIRAAKVLGWTIHNGHYGIPIEQIQSLSLFDNGNFLGMDVGNEKFTKSRDWSMLGVNSLTWHQLGEFCELLRYGVEIKTIGGSTGGGCHFPREIFKAPPLRMTIAWLKVLEGE